MRLYSLPMSAFTARCRIVIYERQLPVEVVPPPDGLYSEAFARITPLRKIPALELDDGQIVVESDVICEYFEDVFTAHALRPADPLLRARTRTVIRVIDNYVAPAVGQLIMAQLGVGNEGKPVPVSENDLEPYRTGLKRLESVIRPVGFAACEEFTLADAAAAPMLYIAYAVVESAGHAAFEPDGRIKQYLHLAASREAVQTVLREQCDDFPPPFREAGERFFTSF